VKDRAHQSGPILTRTG